MNTTSEQQILNDDGTPRRKYEIEEQGENRYLFSATIGLVLASIIIYLKNLLFGEEKADPHIARSSGSSTAGEDAGAGDDALEDVVPDTAEKELFDDDPFEEGPGFVKLLFTTTSASYIAGPPFTPFKTIVPANDNIRLHDALLGSPVMTFPGGGRGNPRPSTGGNASGGGNYDGDYDGGDYDGDDGDGGDYDGDDDEDEDEDPTPENRRPVVTGPVYLGSFFMNQVVIIALADLLRNVSDPDGDTLSISELHTSSGNLSVRYDGSWAFSPDLDDTTDVTFTYTISDGKGGTTQTASLDLLPTHDRPIEGTDGDDSIVGTPGDDVIDALGGDDTIIGREGNDVIHGGDGDDRIVAGDGDDVVYGGAGNDVVFAGAGRDTVFAGIGNDIVFGEEGNDALFGEEGSDTVSGGFGDDTIAGGEGDDSLAGGAGNDLIDGGAGTDNIDGGEDWDIILAAAGDDIAFGGSGDDLFIAVAGDGNDAFDGGEGTDTYDISATSADAIIDLGAGTASSDEIGEDDIVNIENVQSGSGNDTIAGGEGEDSLAGGAGNDLIDGGAGIDNIDGGEDWDIILAAAGDDTVSGGSGDDLFIAVAGDGNDAFDGGEGTDTYDISATSADAIIDLGAGTASSDEIGEDDIVNIENVQSGSGNDTIAGGEGEDSLAGGAGNDLIDGGAGIDNIDGGEDWDIILAAAGDDTVSGGSGDDLFIAVAGDGNDAFDGGEGTDTYDISATSADAIIDLRAGTASSDEIGDDDIDNIENVRGGAGNDLIFASESVNIFSGGEGNDSFLFGTVAAVGRGQGLRDRILDFEVGDRIDLDDISAEFAEAVDATFEDQNIKRFVIIREQDSFTRPGQLKFSYDTFDGNPVTVIQGNIDYDEDAEFELELAGIYELRDEDFHSHG